MNYDPDMYEKIEACPLCADKCPSPAHILYMSAAGGSDDSSGRFRDQIPVVQCKSCGLVYAQYVFTERAKTDFFKNYSTQVHEASEQIVAKRNRMYQIEFDYIANFIDLQSKLKVLDVGCAEGKFLDLFANAGCECFGVEVGEKAAEISSRRYKVYCGNLPDLEFDETYDLIISRGTLEYFEQVHRYLDKMDKLLNDNGLIFITSLQNTDSFCHKLFREQFNLPICAIARNGFSPKVLCDYWTGKGYKLVGEKYFYEETPYADTEEDIRKVYQAIEYKRAGKVIDFKSPAFWGNTMTLVFRKP